MIYGDLKVRLRPRWTMLARLRPIPQLSRASPDETGLVHGDNGFDRPLQRPYFFRVLYPLPPQMSLCNALYGNTSPAGLLVNEPHTAVVLMS